MANFTQGDIDKWFNACQNGDEDTIKQLVAAGFNSDERNRNGENGLVQACNSDDGYKVARLLLDTMYNQYAQQPPKLLEALNLLGSKEEGLPSGLYRKRKFSVAIVADMETSIKRNDKIIDGLISAMRDSLRIANSDRFDKLNDDVSDQEGRSHDALMEKSSAELQIHSLDLFRDRLREVTEAATNAVTNGTFLPNAGGGQSFDQDALAEHDETVRSSNLPPLKPDRTLTLARLQEKKSDGRTNLQIFAEQGQLGDVFTAEIWQGRKDEMDKAWQLVKPEHQNQVNIELVRQQIDAFSLRDRFRRDDDVAQGF